MKVVPGIEALQPADGRLHVVLGVFDGLHRGHLYMLDELKKAAAERGARPAVITFDHHPDEILTGSAPPLLCDPQERLERLAGAGVALTVVHHFDLATRMTPYDTFVRRIAERVDLAGFLMTPESAFGLERGGTPEAVGRLGRELGYQVVVVPTLELGGRAVRSAEIRTDIARGQLAAAASLLGRPYAVVGDARPVGTDLVLAFSMPVALPPPGYYPVAVRDLARDVDLGSGEARIDDAGGMRLSGARPTGPSLRVVFQARSPD